MPGEASVHVLDERIAFVRESLARLTRQAGDISETTDRQDIAERIAGEQALLEDLIRQRKALEP